MNFKTLSDRLVQQLIQAFINAVNTWKMYVVGLKSANKQNNQKAKSVLGKAVFFWIKQAEKLKKPLDVILGVKKLAI